MTTDPLTHALSQDNLRLRGVLEAVATDLESIAAREEYADHTQALLGRAMRIRALLQTGSVDEPEI